jgi:hypothetical protein
LGPFAAGAFRARVRHIDFIIERSGAWAGDDGSIPAVARNRFHL